MNQSEVSRNMFSQNLPPLGVKGILLPMVFEGTIENISCVCAPHAVFGYISKNHGKQNSCSKWCETKCVKVTSSIFQGVHHILFEF